jgi:translation initiation factor IF-2
MHRLSQVARKLNVGSSTIIDFLTLKGFEVDSNPNSKITEEQFILLSKEYASSAMDKEEASGLTIGGRHEEDFVIKQAVHEIKEPSSIEEDRMLIKDNLTEDLDNPVSSSTDHLISKPKLEGTKVIGKIDLEANKKDSPKIPKPPVAAVIEEPASPEQEEKPLLVVPEPAPSLSPIIEEKIPQEPPLQEPPTISRPVEKKMPPVVAAPKEAETIKAKADALQGLKVIGKIELPVEKKKEKLIASSDQNKDRKKRPRKRIPNNEPPAVRAPLAQGARPPAPTTDRTRGRDLRKTEELTDKEIQDKIKSTLAKLSGGGTKGVTANRSKYRKEKRSAKAEEEEEKIIQQAEDDKTLKVTEFISASDLASLMNVTINQVISTCMSLGMFVSINQRLDAETIMVIADEFGFDVTFTSTEEGINIVEEEDDEKDLVNRAPIVTIMGHVDHGKTSLLDFIRNSKVTEGEAGGITQHIGAYDVMTNTGKKVAFLDTPGHEAFTAMRARGAKITDIVIIVVAADDDVMPQTKEAINHAQVAGVPIVIAINKIDRPNANVDKIKESLSTMNILVEDWGGKYQCQAVSAKTGEGIDELLEKVLLEAELLELTANPNKSAIGTVIEASLDKGRGYMTTIMVENGTLKVGDVLLAGSYFGKVKALFDHRGNKMKEVGPATPTMVLGLDGAPQAGDKFNVMDSDREAREVANKRQIIQREQSVRAKKHITLDEIGRRLAIGSFKELNIIVKGDVDGSIEALSDSLLKLSTNEVQVNIIHKGVGQISESDVLLASASDAVIVGFQVRPSSAARKVAENEEIEIRLYSIIYDAINDVKDAMEGMLAPTVQEFITGNIEVREVFKISKVGTVAGCYVTEGFVKRTNQVRLIRDGIVVHSGNINQLKRFKDDVQEVKKSYECGLSIKNFNDIIDGDIIEGFELREIKRSL